MLLFVTGFLGRQRTVTHRVALSNTTSAKTPFILSNIPPFPLCYADTPTGYVFVANGFMEMQKWDGLAFQAFTVGVTPPSTAPVLVKASTSGGIVGTYTAYARWIDKDGNPSNLSPISNSLVIASPGTVSITYNSVPLTSDPKVTTLQLLRNTTGQTSVYYVDVETTDLTSTTFTSTNIDTTLKTQEAVALFDTEGTSIANRFGTPPNHKPYLAMFQGRLFAYGEIEYTDGHAECTFGSTTVSGVGTAWVKAMEGRLFYAIDSPQSYTIESVDVVNQTLTLGTAFAETTNLFTVYCVRPPSAERLSIYFTEAGLFDAWPATNALQIEENGDDGTGLVTIESYLLVLQRRHIYRMTYNTSPITDGGVFLAMDRGCINNNCHVKIDSELYMLDEQGVYSYASGGEAKPLSMGIQDMFWILDSDTSIRINWKSQRYFHAMLSQAESTIRWFIALDGSRKPKNALCYNYATKAWWTERFPVEIASNTLIRPNLVRPVPIVTGPKCKSYALQSLLDQVVAAGTTRGTVTAGTLLSLSDTTASFQSSGLVGASVSILDGSGKGQQRRITGVSGTTLTLDRPFTVAIGVDSVYQIGAIQWFWRGVWSRWLDEDQSNVRRIVIVFEPSDNEVMNARLFRDQLETPETWGSARQAVDPESITVRDDDPDLLINLQQAQGFAQIRMDSRREMYLQRRDYFALEMEGASDGHLRIYEVIVEGTKKE